MGSGMGAEPWQKGAELVLTFHYVVPCCAFIELKV